MELDHLVVLQSEVLQGEAMELDRTRGRGPPMELVRRLRMRRRTSGGGSSAGSCRGWGRGAQMRRNISVEDLEARRLLLGLW